MSPYFLQQRYILFLLTWNPRLPHFTSLPVNHILMFRPLLTISCLLTCSSPFLTMLPLRNENDTPDHNDKSIDEICRTVLSCIVEHIVPNRCQYTYQSRKDQPFLEEGYESEICLRVGSKIFFEIAQDYPSVFWIFVDRNQLLESCMSHDISQRIKLCVDMVGWSFLLDAVG